MPGSRNIAEELAFASNLKQIVSAYEEIAVMRIDKVRRRVLSARLFRQELSFVFSRVRASHNNDVQRALKEKSKHQPLKKATVLLSTNSRFSGPITSRVSGAFLRHVKQHPSDLVVVGQVGKEHVQSVLPDAKFTYFPLPNHQPGNNDLAPLVKHLLQYQSSAIFFGHFANLIEQKPSFVELGTQESEKQTTSHAWGGPSGEYYYFEPSLEEVVKFFNDQILATLVGLTSGESWLSLLGSRITAMEQASGNIGRQLSSLHMEKLRADRRRRSKKQRDRLAGMSLWY